MYLIIPLEKICHSLQRQEEIQLQEAHTQHGVFFDKVWKCPLIERDETLTCGYWIRRSNRSDEEQFLYVFEIGSPYVTLTSLDLQSPYLYPLDEANTCVLPGLAGVANCHRTAGMFSATYNVFRVVNNGMTLSKLISL